jgi:hypothetical protein
MKMSTWVDTLAELPPTQDVEFVKRNMKCLPSFTIMPFLIILIMT